MKKFLLAFVILLTISLLKVYAQKESYNWMCGDTFGLNFNTPDLYPVLLKIPIKRDNCSYVSPDSSYNIIDGAFATVSDSSGNYLFSSYGGMNIWNKKNKLIYSCKDMNWDLSGCYHDNQYPQRPISNYIVKRPGSNNSYYNFYIKFDPCLRDFKNRRINSYINYHIIDMNLDKGSGGINISDIPFLHKYIKFEENINYLPIQHANKKDFWIVVFLPDTNYAYSYLLTETGLDTVNPVISKLNSIPAPIYYNSQTHSLKVSSKGNLIAFMPDSMGTINLYDFDPSSGKISESRMKIKTNDTAITKGFIEAPNSNFEFSSDGSKLYHIYNKRYEGSGAEYQTYFYIYQYDLNNKAQTVLVDTIKGYDFANWDQNRMQIGPDGRIYILNMLMEEHYYQYPYYFTDILVINKPNEIGKACNLNKNFLKVKCYRPIKPTNKSYIGWNTFVSFPANVKGKYYADITAGGSSPVCEGENIVLTSQLSFDMNSVKFYWTGPNGFQSNEQNPVIKNATAGMTGAYIAKYESRGYSSIDTVVITVLPKPEVKIDGRTKICEGEKTVLKSKYDISNDDFSWSTGDTKQSITASKAGKYILTVENSSGCRASDTVEVTVSPMPQAEIEGATTICEGDSTVLSSKYSDSGYNYSWSTGETTKDITVRNSGTYILIIENESGCRAADTAIVCVVPSITPNITTSNGRTSLCEGETIKLLSEPKGSGYSYLWSTGETTPDIEINKEGSYSVTISLNGKCEGTNSIDIKVNPRPVVNIEGSTSICPGNESALRTDKPYSLYSWSTGETTREIKITKPGSYSVTVTDTNGCSASASIDVKESDIIITGLSDIDFGRICSGETAEKEITIKNESQDSVNISEIKLQSGTTVFTSPSIKRGPVGVLPNSTLSIKLTFSPVQIGHYKDTVLITTDYPCPVTFKSEIKGTAYARTLVFLPDTTVSIGDNIAIPMKTKLVCGNALPPDAHYQAEICFAASALLPDEIQEPGVTDNGIISGTRTFSITGTGTKSIKGRVMLALQDSIPLIIKSFNWNNELIENETKNGILRIKGLCQQNLSKVKTFGVPALSITPNPAGSEATLHISGDIKGTVNIGIYTMAGTRLEIMKFEKQKNEEEINISLEELSCGIYQLIATIEGNTIAEKLVVIK